MVFEVFYKGIKVNCLKYKELSTKEEKSNTLKSSKKLFVFRKWGKSHCCGTRVQISHRINQLFQSIPECPLLTPSNLTSSMGLSAKFGKERR